MEIQQIKVKAKSPMLRQVRGLTKKQTKDREYDEKGMNNKSGEKRRNLTFIVGVINATAETRSKTERIQIIVKAVVHHLDLIGLKWKK